MKKQILLFVSVFIFLACGTFRAQGQKEELIQFSGITITADSLNPVPFTKILIKDKNKGTTTDMVGYFSFIAHKSDTILFNALGYKPVSFIIPDTITKNRYSLIQLMTADTLTLAAAIIFPWPTLDDFKRAFVNLDIPDDDMTRARKNLDIAAFQMQVDNHPMDAGANYHNYMENQTSKLYYFGQQQPISILNPFAWAKFIQAWKNGDFKRKKYKDQE